MLFEHKATRQMQRQAQLAIERGWLRLQEIGTYVKFTQAGANMFA